MYEMILAYYLLRASDPFNIVYDIIFLITTLILQYIISRRCRRKNDLVELFILELLIPLAIGIFFIILAPNPLGGFLIIAGILLLFTILNYTEIWYRENFYYAGEHLVVMKFHDTGSESEIVRIYEDDAYITRTLDEVLAKSAEIGENFLDENFYEGVLDLAGVRITQKMTEDEKKQKALKILKEKFGHYYVHQVYFKYYFINIDYEEIDIHSYVQAFILSTRERLPRDIIMTCTLLKEQKIKGKKHTMIIGVEGTLDEDLAQKMLMLSNDMEFFKLTAQYSDTSQMEVELNYYRNKVESLLEAFEDLAKQDLTINSKVAYYRPQKQKQLKKKYWRREE